ncbi:hypothetical protein AB0H76_09790 [Nocardia sp. NPDC050712]|uniref:hypothetical protein n=1 Tax=Nocardia sp. NPDC050712 TaxID=3155518 RepID=UPI0033C621C2
MNDQNQTHCRTTESEMRRDYDTVYALRQASLNAVTAVEYDELRDDAEHRERRWLARTDRWAAEWQFLDNAVQGWAENPAAMRCTRYELLRNVVFGRTPLEQVKTRVASLLQADRLTGRGRRSLRSTRRTCGPLAYFAFYRELFCHDDDSFTVHTSWWHARQWLGQQAQTQSSDRYVAAEIVAVDCLSGKRYPLIEANATTNAELAAEMTYLNRLLSDFLAAEGPMHAEVRYDELAGAYLEAFIAANHHDAGLHRIEHRLHADDLRDQALDLAARLGVPAADHLSVLDHDTAERARTTPAPPTGWLDACTHRFRTDRQRPGSAGFFIRYRLSTGAPTAIQLGWDPTKPQRPWQGQEVRLGRDGAPNGRHRAIGEFSSLGELLQNVENWCQPTYPGQSSAVRLYAARRLKEWSDHLAELERATTTSAAIRDALQTGKPYELIPSHWSTANQPEADPTHPVGGPDAAD